MLKVGLTGGIGSGKTTVTNLFKDLGVHIIDTDIIAHDLVSSEQNVLNEIIETFGQTVVSKNGSLDRQKLAQIVFHNQPEKKRLENILHPKIREEVNKQLQTINHDINDNKSQARYSIIVIPLLLETDFRDLIDRILVVMANEDIRIERVKQRDHRNMNDIRSIIGNQVNDEKRLAEADDIIKNNSNIKDLDSQIQQLHKKYMVLSATGG
jgi:dephospho-CoA kinase